mgnify:CR=1 FL=1
MKFEKLVNMFAEAKGVQGGNAIFNAKNAAGPKGLSNQSAGFSDNNELLKPKKKWEFKSKSGGDVTDEDGNKLNIKKDMDVQSRAWKVLNNAFSLLANDPSLASHIKTIADEFDRQRDGYQTMMGGEDKKGKKIKVKYDEESKINSLPATIDKQKSKRTGYETIISNNSTTIRNSKMLPSQKLALEMEISSLESELTQIEKQLERKDIHWKSENNLKLKLKKIANRLPALETKYAPTKYPQSAIDALYRANGEADEAIEALDKKIEKNETELATLTDRTTKIQSNNEGLNEVYLDRVKTEINTSASRLHAALSGEIGERQTLISDDIDWEEPPEEIEAKLKMLEDLTSTDPAINPILGYVAAYERFYNGTNEDDMGDNRVKDLDEREFNPQTNITKMRDYNALPLVRLLTIYSNSKLSKMSLKVTPDMVRHDTSYSNFNGYIEQFPSSKDTDIINQQRRMWDDPEIKDMLRSFVDGMGIEDKKTQYNVINGSFKVARSGLNSFGQLKSSIDSDMKRFGHLKAFSDLKSESFDDYTERMLKSLEYDEDSFKIDMIEILTK